jgi:hypothetical protein
MLHVCLSAKSISNRYFLVQQTTSKFAIGSRQRLFPTSIKSLKESTHAEYVVDEGYGEG